MPTDLVLDDTAVIIDAPTLKIQGGDLVLDHASKRGGSLTGLRRAVVHGDGDVLHLNYAGDYRGGARVHGKLLVDLPVFRPGRAATPESPATEPRYELEATELGATLRKLMDQIEALQEQAEQLQIRATITAEASHYTQAGWRWCDGCSNLHFEPNQRRGVCSATKQWHGSGKSIPYVLFVRASRHGGEAGWGWCRKCQSLCHGSTPIEGHCPAGGAHDRSASPRYLVWCCDDASASASASASADAKPREFQGQDQWRRCSQCSSLFHASLAGVCPAPGAAGHQAAGSPNYHLECQA